MVGGGDSALDAALMVLGRGGQVDVVVRGQTLAGRADAFEQGDRRRRCRPYLHRSRRRGSRPAIRSGCRSATAGMLTVALS